VGFHEGTPVPPAVPSEVEEQHGRAEATGLMLPQAPRLHNGKKTLLSMGAQQALRCVTSKKMAALALDFKLFWRNKSQRGHRRRLIATTRGRTQALALKARMRLPGGR